VFLVGYSESLLLFLLGCYLAFSSTRWWWISLAAAALVPFCRPTGVLFAAIPLVRWILLPGSRRGPVLLLAFITGECGYLTLMASLTGNPFAGFDAQHFYANAPSLNHFLMPREWLDRFLSVSAFHSPTESALDRMMFLMGVFGVWQLYRLRPSWCFAGLCLIVIPATTGWFLSFSRLSLSATPLFLGCSAFLASQSRRRLVILCAGSMVLQGVLISRFLQFEWAT
jgi:hypothetical protein